MIKKIFLIFSLFFIYSQIEVSAEDKIYIVLKIDNEIITNHDIEKEIKYLIAINNQLETIQYKEIKIYAKESLIKEIIKKKEILKYFLLNQDTDFLNAAMVNFYKKIKLENEKEFKEYLSKYDLTIEYVKKKFEIEQVWNELIFTKYNNQVNLDVESIKKRVKQSLINKKIKSKVFLLSEILYQTDNKADSKKKYNQIISSINKIGFNNTANVFSISDTSKFGGDIGWINERQLSKNILEKIQNLKEGDISEPLIVPGGTIILKVESTRIEESDYNFEDELNKIIAYEKNKQFNQFSSVYYNKIKFNSKINEF